MEIVFLVGVILPVKTQYAGPYMPAPIVAMPPPIVAVPPSVIMLMGNTGDEKKDQTSTTSTTTTTEKPKIEVFLPAVLPVTPALPELCTTMSKCPPNAMNPVPMCGPAVLPMMPVAPPPALVVYPIRLPSITDINALKTDSASCEENSRRKNKKKGKFRKSKKSRKRKRRNRRKNYRKGFMKKYRRSGRKDKMRVKPYLTYVDSRGEVKIEHQLDDSSAIDLLMKKP